MVATWHVYCIETRIRQKRGDALNWTRLIQMPRGRMRQRMTQRMALSILFSWAVVACGKYPERPSSPQAPARPQASAGVASHVHHALFSYTGNAARLFQYQDPSDEKMPKLVIQT